MITSKLLAIILIAYVSAHALFYRLSDEGVYLLVAGMGLTALGLLLVLRLKDRTTQRGRRP